MTTPNPQKWIPGPTNMLSGTRTFTFTNGSGPPRAKDLKDLKGPDGALSLNFSPPEKRYILLGETVTSSDSICALLRRWVEKRQSGPLQEDREAVAGFFKMLALEGSQRVACECVHMFRVELCRGQEAWVPAADYLVDAVNEAVRGAGCSV